MTISRRKFLWMTAGTLGYLALSPLVSEGKKAPLEDKKKDSPNLFVNTDLETIAKEAFLATWNHRKTQGKTLYFSDSTILEASERRDGKDADLDIVRYALSFDSKDPDKFHSVLAEGRISKSTLKVPGIDDIRRIDPSKYFLGVGIFELVPEPDDVSVTKISRKKKRFINAKSDLAGIIQTAQIIEYGEDEKHVNFVNFKVRFGGQVEYFVPAAEKMRNASEYAAMYKTEVLDPCRAVLRELNAKLVRP